MRSEVKLSFTYVKVCLTLKHPGEQRYKYNQKDCLTAYEAGVGDGYKTCNIRTTCIFIFTVFVFENFQKFMYRYLQYDTLLFVKIDLYVLSYIIASHGRVCYFHFVYFVEFFTLNPYWLAMPVIRTVEQMITGFAPYFRLKRSVNNVLNVIIIIIY